MLRREGIGNKPLFITTVNNMSKSPHSSRDSDAQNFTDGARVSAWEDEHNRVECTNRIIQLNSINKKLKDEIRCLGNVHKVDMQSMINALNDNFKADIQKFET
jgi:hypothetical protein